jgi:histidinol-phosphate aminotransferase
MIYDQIPKHIRQIDPSDPGEPTGEIERQLFAQAINLAYNENSLGPSPLAIAAATTALTKAAHYPQAIGTDLCNALAARLGAPPERIIVGNGSTDLISVVASTLLVPGSNAVTSEGSYPVYYVAILRTGAKLIALPLLDFALDLNAIAAAVESETKLIFVANPNNPTGTMFDKDAFTTLRRRVPDRVLIVVDEAYGEYVSAPHYPNAIQAAEDLDNVLVLRTFSKVYGLAGLRIGYGIGPPELLEEMRKIQLPFNTSGVAQAAALAALKDTDHVEKSIEMNQLGLEQLERGLRGMGVSFVPSVANFILTRVDCNASALAEELLKLGVVVRPMERWGLPGTIRVTVGTFSENEQFLHSLAKLRTQPQHLLRYAD